MSEVLCIDLGKDSVKLSLINEGLDNQEYQRFSTPEVLSQLLDNVQEYYKYLKNKYNIIGFSISCCGVINQSAGTVINSCIDYLDDIDVLSIFEEILNLKGVIENDVNCMSIAEMRRGVLKDVSKAVYLFLGPEIGGSVIIDGHLVKGKHFLGGNFEKMLVRDRKGYLNTLNELISIKSMIKKIEAIDEDIWNDKRLLEETKKGNDKCENIINTFFIQLGIELINIQAFIDPDLLVIGGFIANKENFNRFLKKAYDKINKQVDVEIEPKITFGQYEDNATLIGAYFNFMENNDI